MTSMPWAKLPCTMELGEEKGCIVASGGRGGRKMVLPTAGVPTPSSCSRVMQDCIYPAPLTR